MAIDERYVKESTSYVGGNADGILSNVADYLGKDKDDVFEMLDNISMAEECEIYGSLIKDATISPQWGSEVFWEDNNYSPSGWRHYFNNNSELAQFVMQLQEHEGKRAKGQESTKEEAEEEQVEFEKKNNGEDLGDTKGADGGYLGGR